MRPCLSFLLLLFAASAALAAADTPDAAVDHRDGRYFGHLSFRVAVPPELALAVLTDFEHMASFVPNLDRSRILSRNGNIYRVAQEGRADFGPFSFRFVSERRVEIFPEGRVVANALSGTAKYLHSELRLKPAGNDGTWIDYQLEMVPDTWFPASLGSSFLRHELIEQFTALAGEMQRRQRAGP